MAPKPQALPVNEAGIPAALKARPKWIVWAYDWMEDKEGWVKAPKDARTGRTCSATDPALWLSFEDAYRAYQTGRRYDGIGYCFSAEDPFTGIDFDRCRDPETGKLDADARHWIRQLDTYTEVSASGGGAHAYALAEGPFSRHKQGTGPGPYSQGKGRAIEVYDRQRYFIVTGQRLSDTPPDIRPAQEAVNALYDAIFPPEDATPRAAAPPRGDAPADLSDEEILRLAGRAGNAAKFRRLWDGDGSAYDNDDSRVALALCSLLAFWTDDPHQVDRLFRQSGLYRPKWDERRLESTWGWDTIKRAYELRTARFEGKLSRDSEAGPARMQMGISAQEDTPFESQPNIGSEEAVEWGPELQEAPGGVAGGEEEEGGDNPLLHIYTAAQLQREVLPPPAWAVNGIVPEGATFLLGQPKVGKSYIHTDMAGGVSLGGKALSSIDVTRGKVLMVSMEDGKRRLQDRLRVFFEIERDWPEWLSITHEWPQVGAGSPGLQYLERWILANPEARMVILDTWNALRPKHSKDGDLAKEDYENIRAINRLGKRYHVAILIIHHMAKSKVEDFVNAGAGTHGLAAAAEAILAFQRLRGEHEGKLYVTGKDVIEATYLMRRDPRTGFWSMLGEEDATETTEARAQVTDYLEEHGPQSCRTISRGIGHPEGGLWSVLRNMARSGDILKEGSLYRVPTAAERFFQ